MGCDCVGMVWGCFMCQVGSKLKVITLADYVQSEYIGKDGKPKVCACVLNLCSIVHSLSLSQAPTDRTAASLSPCVLRSR